jgi:hypothetical protein
MSRYSSTFFPKNIGRPWKDDDITQLLKGVKDKKTPDEIAIQLKRTPYCIKTKLKSMASTLYIKDNKDFTEIHAITGVQKNDIIILPLIKPVDPVPEEPMTLSTTCMLMALPVVDTFLACAIMLRLHMRF